MKRPRTRIVLFTSALAVGAIGALHLPIARPLLARMGVSCPVDSVSAVQVETLHRAAFHALRGDARAPNLDAFGLTVTKDHQEDVRAWTRTRGMTCTSVTRGLHYLSCGNVPAGALGAQAGGEAIQDLTFTFDSKDVLVGVDALRGGLTSVKAAALSSSIAHRLRGVLGPPAEQVGAFDAAFLDAGAFRTSYIKYRFADSLVTLTAVQMPGRGVSVREQYVGMHDAS